MPMRGPTGGNLLDMAASVESSLGSFRATWLTVAMPKAGNFRRTRAALED